MSWKILAYSDVENFQIIFFLNKILIPRIFYNKKPQGYISKLDDEEEAIK